MTLDSDTCLDLVLNHCSAATVFHLVVQFAIACLPRFVVPAPCYNTNIQYLAPKSAYVIYDYIAVCIKFSSFYGCCVLMILENATIVFS